MQSGSSKKGLILAIVGIILVAALVYAVVATSKPITPGTAVGVLGDNPVSVLTDVILLG